MLLGNLDNFVLYNGDILGVAWKLRNEWVFLLVVV